MSGQSWYVIAVLFAAAVVAAIVLGVPFPLLTKYVPYGVACVVVYWLLRRPSKSTRLNRVERSIVGKSPPKHVVTASSRKLSPFVKVVLLLVALVVTFFAGAVWQRANDEMEMRAHRLLNAGIATSEELRRLNRSNSEETAE